MRVFRREKPTVKCFTREYQRTDLLNPIDRGVESVDIDKIVGSLGRHMDFSEGFKPRRKVFSPSNQRFKAIRESMEKGVAMPSIELYKVKDEYYVVDGHHRLLAAKNLGRLSIDAHVVEFLPSGDNPEDELYRTRIYFEIKTGLEEIRLSQKGLYSTLMDEIKRHHQRLEIEDKTFTLDESARKWYNNIYLPAVEEIRDSGILRFFLDLTIGDVYTYLRQYRNLCSQKPCIETLDEGNENRELKKLTGELSFLLKEDPDLHSDETIRRLEDILPSPLRSRFHPHSPRHEKNTYSTKQRIIKILSRT